MCPQTVSGPEIVQGVVEAGLHVYMLTHSDSV